MFLKNFKPFFSPERVEDAAADVEEETGGLDQGSDVNSGESGTDETPNVEDTMTEPLEPRSRSEKMFAKMAGNPSFQNFEARSRREHFLDDLAKSKGSSGGGSPMVSVTYQELVALRDGSQLVPGMQYRITDYVCTVANDAEAQAVSHPYDIIVTADDAGTLNENARACLHEGDSYYSAEGSVADLTAWELKYCLDNDTSRFAWADATNGKGVVFWLKDEHGNECPYDFKQIQFKRYKITACEKAPDLVGRWSTKDNDNITIDNSDFIWAYTFSYVLSQGNEDQSIDDWSVIKHGNYLTEDNTIKPRFTPDGKPMDPSFDKWLLNNIAWVGYEYIDGDFHEDGIAPIANTFGNNCRYNTFGNDCRSNTFGNDCGSNTFGNDCWYNTFGNNCWSNTFGNNCGSNTFGNDCWSNTFGNNCRYNTFGNNCGSNTFGNDCWSNTFGNDCRYNTFGNDCWYNTFGNDCGSNTFGNDCWYNTFGNNAQGDEASAYCRWCTFEDGVKGVVLSNDSATNANQIQNYHVLNGTQGVMKTGLVLGNPVQTPITINASLGLSYCTYVGKNSSGVVKTWAPADLVQS